MVSNMHLLSVSFIACFGDVWNVGEDHNKAKWMSIKECQAWGTTMSIWGQTSIVALKSKRMYMTYYVIIEGLPSLHISRPCILFCIDQNLVRKHGALSHVAKLVHNKRSRCDDTLLPHCYYHLFYAIWATWGHYVHVIHYKVNFLSQVDVQRTKCFQLDVHKAQ